MKLLTQELRRDLPALYSQERNPDPKVFAKFFTPDSRWTWWVTEGSPEGNDFRFFGYVRGLESEWGYFMLSELEAARAAHTACPSSATYGSCPDHFTMLYPRLIDMTRN